MVDLKFYSRKMNVPVIYKISVLYVALHFTVAFVNSVDSVVWKNDTYEWRTGQWGSCFSPRNCGEGSKRRQVRCVHYPEGFVVSDWNCNSVTKPKDADTCFRVCEMHKNILRWSVGPWSPCKPSKSVHSANDCTSVTAGVARRLVTCVFLSDSGLLQEVDNQACKYFWEEPVSSMTCSLECPQACVMAERRCIENCCANDSKTVQEVVIVAPERGGLDCPDLTDPVCFDADTVVGAKSSSKHYILKIGEWSSCEPENEELKQTERSDPFSLKPVVGIRRRNVTCLNSRGETVELNLCVNLSNLPPLDQRCVVSEDCEVSPWSEWRIAEEGCVNSEGRVTPEVRVRTRHLVKLPAGRGEPCPFLYESRTVAEKLPPCYKYKWLPLEWSDCLVTEHLPSKQPALIRPSCGSGVQIRNLTCLRVSDLVPVGEEWCKEPRPSAIQLCKVPCRRDCRVSPWGRWGPCLPSNTTNFFEPIDSGLRRRVRSILVGPSGGGAPCPHLEEIDPCLNQELFGWQYGEWSECSTGDTGRGVTCGSGQRTRSSTCVKWNGSPTGEFMCRHHVPQDNTTEQCRVPCPHDCLLSEWSGWTACSLPCASRDNVGERTRNRTLIAVAGPAGRKCSNQRTQKELCNWQSCSTLKWVTSDWSECLLAPKPEGQNFCGPGVQRRDLFCTLGDDTDKPHTLCAPLLKPAVEQDCEIPCPVDCVTTKFSDWSSCPTNCSLEADQYRKRYIQQNPKYGGEECPESLEEARPCGQKNEIFCVDLEKTRPLYRWKVGKYSPCILFETNQTCGSGFQLRDVSCVDANDQSVEPHLCLSFDVSTSDLTKLLTLVPSSFRFCQVTCRQPSCAFSFWSEWTTCHHQYKAKRSRYRELIDESLNNVLCKSVQALEEEDECPLLSPYSGDAANSHWMSCLVEGDNQTVVIVNGKRVFRDCGAGYRYKPGLQIQNLDSVEPGLEKDFCFVDCPVDCRLSDWSSWSHCNVPCGQGFRERKRHVLVPANKIGRPCPPNVVNGTEVHRDVCTVPCSQFHWVAFGWSDCQVYFSQEEAVCGNGTQYRTVRCIDKSTETFVEAIHCDPLKKPLSHSTCRVYCPEECVVSSWVTWQECSEPCLESNFFVRRRRILRQPNPSFECPPILKKQPCVFNETCFEHKWDIGPWGSCILPEGAFCGEGVQQLPLFCRRSDGRQVDAVQCEKTKESLSLKVQTSKPCYVDCPVDCEVSSWSEWDSSQCPVCGNSGKLTRTRQILQPPTDTGQPCPSTMEQSKPCPFKPCFHWNATEWSSCDLQGADCGSGVRRRTVHCVRYDGLQVDSVYCLIANITFPARSWLNPGWLLKAHDKKEEESCYVPCFGDCLMSSWSEWSHCHRDCISGQRVGYQTSSRVILSRELLPHGQKCSQILWRTRPCWDGDCQTFQWRIRNYTLQCERSDGLILKGGCDVAKAPVRAKCYPCEWLSGARCECPCPHRSYIHRNVEKWRSVMLYCGHDDHRPRRTDVKMDPKRPVNHSAPTQEIRLKYYPDDTQVSFWMYAMISIGTAFVIFVVVTVYLMCRSSIRRRIVSVQRQGSVRRRGPSSPDDPASSPYKC